MFPPGRAKLATNPICTGSCAGHITIGTVAVAALAPTTAGVWKATITSTSSATSSRASDGRRAGDPSALRNSSATVLPSTYPSSRRASPNCCKNKAGIGVPSIRMPIRGILFVCGSAIDGATAALAAIKARNFRRLILFSRIRKLSFVASAGRMSQRVRTLRYFLDRLAVDAGLAVQIVDGDVRVVPGQPRPHAETLRQFGDARFGEPGLRRLAAVPEINAAGAGLPVQVVLPDQAFLGEPAINRRARHAAFHRHLLGALRQIELNDDDAIGHGWLLMVLTC